MIHVLLTLKTHYAVSVLKKFRPVKNEFRVAKSVSWNSRQN